MIFIDFLEHDIAVTLRNVLFNDEAWMAGGSQVVPTFADLQKHRTEVSSLEAVVYVEDEKRFYQHRRGSESEGERWEVCDIHGKNPLASLRIESGSVIYRYQQFGFTRSRKLDATVRCRPMEEFDLFEPGIYAIHTSMARGPERSFDIQLEPTPTIAKLTVWGTSTQATWNFLDREEPTSMLLGGGIEATIDDAVKVPDINIFKLKTAFERIADDEGV